MKNLEPLLLLLSHRLSMKECEQGEVSVQKSRSEVVRGFDIITRFPA